MLVDDIHYFLRKFRFSSLLYTKLYMALYDSHRK